MVNGAPGSGKTQLAIQQAISAYQQGKRVIFATNSNTQSFDIARRLRQQAPNLRVVLYHRSNLNIPRILEKKGIQTATGTRLFSKGPCIVLSNASKWAWVKDPIPHFDLMIIDDAGTLRESLFMQIAGLADRFLILHNAVPHQPIIRSNTKRWEHMNHAPHRSIINTMPRYPLPTHTTIRKTTLAHSHRLPQDTIDILFPHVFPISVRAEATIRRLEIPTCSSPLFHAINSGQSLVMQHLKNTSPFIRAQWIADNIRQLLAQKTMVYDSRMKGRLSPAKIGIICTDHTQVLLMEKALGSLAKEVYIDVHIHQHSLERALIYAFHPLGQLSHPNRYHWDPALLSLLLTRHRVACILVAQNLSYTRPSYARGLYDQQTPSIQGYHAHRNLQKQLQHRIYSQASCT